jgi:hypothetical protein
MATNINLFPKANLNLLSGKLQSALSDSANYFVGDVVPSSNRLPTYIWIDYGTSKAELCKVYDVSGSNIYIKRGINNGNVGIAHDSGASYYEAITTYHINSITDALIGGWVLDHIDIYTFSRVSTTSFTIAGVDRTNYYATNVLVRFNGSSVTKITSSSYSSGNTTVNVADAVVPATISSIEIYLNIAFGIEHNANGTHDSTKVAMLAGTQTFTGDKTFSGALKTNAVDEATSGNGVTVDGLLIKDKAIQQMYNNGNITGSVTINWANGLRQKATLTGNVTLNFSNPVEGQSLELFLIQDGTGGRTISFTPTITWQDATVPTWTTQAGKVNVISLRYIGTSYYGMGSKCA